MKPQAQIFHESEGNAWLERNRDRLGQEDMVSETIEMMRIRPTFAVEIGCANGWRLAKLRDKYGCEIVGVEPSRHACEEAGALRVPVFQTTAATPPIRGGLADLLIYGFCLYLADPSDWFKIVAEGDRILAPGGHLLIHDFAAVDYPFARPYEHCEGVTAYHVDFAQFWLSSPLYSMVRRTMAYERDQMVTVLRKLPIDRIEVLPDGENP